MTDVNCEDEVQASKSHLSEKERSKDRLRKTKLFVKKLIKRTRLSGMVDNLYRLLAHVIIII